MKKNKIKNRKKVRDVISAWLNNAKSDTNTSGWYTGIPDSDDFLPEQDEDDL